MILLSEQTMSLQLDPGNLVAIQAFDRRSQI